jgi:phospholipid/cholesterol/gamma-HCH transport system ATP-binding protein
MLHEFDPETAEAIRASLPEDLLAMADSGQFEPTSGAGGRHWAPDSDRQGQSARSSTATLPRQGDDG